VGQVVACPLLQEPSQMPGRPTLVVQTGAAGTWPSAHSGSCMLGGSLAGGAVQQLAWAGGGGGCSAAVHGGSCVHVAGA
jgi:hypothetical protein